MKDSFKDIRKKFFKDYVAYSAKTDLNNVKDSFSDEEACIAYVAWVTKTALVGHKLHLVIDWSSSLNVISNGN